MKVFRLKTLINTIRKQITYDIKEGVKVAANNINDKSNMKKDSKENLNNQNKQAEGESIEFNNKTRGEGRILKKDEGSGSSNEKNLERNNIHETVKDKQDNTFGEKHEVNNKEQGNRRI